MATRSRIELDATHATDAGACRQALDVLLRAAERLEAEQSLPHSGGVSQPVSAQHPERTSASPARLATFSGRTKAA